MSLTIACVWVRGHVPFSAQYVTKLRDMVRRFAPAHRFVCLTDRPEQLPGVECIDIKAQVGMFAWWAKLELFNSRHGLAGRVLFLDLDVLVVSDLRPIIDFQSAFAIVPDGAPNFQPKNGLAVVKAFNSSVMVWTAGELNFLFDDWSPRVAGRLWGDQDWIGERAPWAVTMPAQWFPRLSSARPPWDAEHKVVLCKKPKNEDAARVFPWFSSAWG